MTTARDFIQLALKEAGVLGIGQTANAEDINDCFTILTRMLAQWQKRRWIIPDLIDVSAAGNNLISNQIGPGKHYNVMRPDKIQAAYFKQLNAQSVANTVSYPLIPIWSREDYSKIQLKNLNSWPTYYFYDNAFPIGNVFIWPIPSASYEIHLVLKGPIGFTVVISAGTITNAGSGYTNGAYLAVPLITASGFGSGATADVTIAGGIVTAFTLADGGTGYNIGDTASLDTTIVGAGANFLYTVDNVTTDLDAEFNMPPEYEEAIHYNLCVRIVSMYQLPTNPVQGQLAKLALNTLRNSNTQISKLQMPSALRWNRGGSNWYIFNADAR